MKQKRQSLQADIHLWRWSFRGMTPDGNTVKFSGVIEAPNDRMGDTALREVDKMMRGKYPEIRWMHGREVETETMKFGPTVIRGKFLREGKVESEVTP